VISTYRRVLAMPGALAFSMSGLVARLPISMVSLGIVLLVSSATGSYGIAGAVSASFLIAGAAFAVLQARLVDRLGQHRVLPWTVSVFAAGLAAMMWTVEAGLPSPAPQLCAAVAGGAMPQVGSCVRARWSYLVGDKRLLQTAFAFEAVVDETVFIVGPVLVTVLATAVHPLAGLSSAIVASLVGTGVLVSLRATEPPARGATGGVHGHGRMRWWVMGPLVLSAIAMGVLFGGSEVCVVAFSQALGDKAASGPLLATLALGSMLSGLVTGALQIRASHEARYRWGLLALALALLPLPFVGGIALMGVFLLLAGLAISPTLIAAVARIEETVPAGRLTEGIAMFTTGLAAGLAPGAALAGMAVDHWGASSAFWVPAAAVLLGAAVAFAAALLAHVSRAGSSPNGWSG
jgi:MFS family permease